MSKKNAKAALFDFQSAIARAPTYYEAFYQGGMAYLSQQDTIQAENSFANPWRSVTGSAPMRTLPGHPTASAQSSPGR
jgi:hypothetical protein